MEESHHHILLYDADCPLCCQLAVWAERRAPGKILRRPLQDVGGDAVKLGVKRPNGELVFGREAWRVLLEQHPDFKGLRWIGRKLGLEDQLAEGLQRTGSFIRRVCWRC